MIIKNRYEHLKGQLDFVYAHYNKKEYIHPDPLEFLDSYPHSKDREIAALIAASLAYGRVDQILKHVASVFGIMNASKDIVNTNNPLNSYLVVNSNDNIVADFKNFKYRFTKGEHMSALLIGMKNMISEFGSLKECFLSAISPDDDTILPAMTMFVQKITEGKNTGNLMASPQKGSACKRNNLFLRWLVRKDDVDPGGWDEIPSSKLIVPLDTHMHHAGKILGFTKRKQANMKTAIEITEGFRRICPDDPVKYDFCLTRFGIHPEMNFSELEKIIRNKI